MSFGSSVMRSKIIRKSGVLAAVAATALIPILVCGPVWAQYPGQIAKKSKDAGPDLRAVAVLEWTGDLTKPKTARIVPVTIYDGEKLQDAGIYLARPQPLALSGEVEYELKQNGKTFGYFDVQNAGQEQGTWVGFGKWKPLPPPKPVKAASPAKVDDYADDDKPVLHRKKGTSDASGGSGSDSASSGPADPDRPTLHKKTSDGSGTGSSSDSSNSGDAAPAPDPDRPKLEKKTSDNGSPTSSSGTGASPDADRPTLSKGNQAPQPDYLGNVSAVRSADDSDRPTLKHGKSAGVTADVTPTLMGLPEDMQQAVAVSDARNRPEHPWTFAWANPDDEGKMQAEMEDLAREALGLSVTTPAATPARASRSPATPAARKTTKAAAPPSAQAQLENEQFRVFELAYGAGATLVLTAHSGGLPTSQKFVTIVAQPDLYGHVRVLLKSVTDAAHLDERPRMRLVDAVDALADNRAELLFELRGDGSRQFALYRIYRGTVEKLFVSGGGVFGNVSSE
jgi:hypothetical protein